MSGGIIKFLFAILLAAFVFSACSSSSYSERYSQKNDSIKKPPDKSVRFTSQSYIKEFDVPPVEDHPVDKSEVIKRYENIVKTKAALSPREKVLFEIINFLNSPYSYGGNSKNGIDCSAFTQKVFGNSLNVKLPRTASQQFNIGERVEGINNLKFGDLIFFNTTRTRFPGHVGIYLGKNLFAHSSVHHGVTVSSLESSYYKDRFVGGRRIVAFPSGVKLSK